MWYNKNFFKYATAIILCLIIIYLFGQVQFLLEPFKKLLAALFFPIIISALFYYILRPVVRFLERIHVSKTLAVMMVLVISTVLFVLAGFFTVTMVIDQVTQLSHDFPKLRAYSEQLITEWSGSMKLSFIPFSLFQEQFTKLSQELFTSRPNSIISFVLALTNFATMLLLVPFIVFFLLKDDNIFAAQLLKLIPPEHKKSGEEILDDIDKTLSAYILSQVIISIFIAVLMYIGYTLAGVNYAFVLALFAAVTNIIPIVGSILGVLPALLVGLPGGVFLIVKILIIMAVVQVVQGNLLSPLILGKRMDIHPLTYIIIFMAGATVYGFVGLLVAVPAYAVCRIIFGKLAHIYRLRKKQA
ncbi:MAG TPA: AI-2E family transporter [Clostridia bacterium]